MAIQKGAYLSENYIAGKLRYVTISGTIKKNEVGVVRNIYVYKNDAPSVQIATGFSDESGNFSFSVIGGPGDRFTILCLGKDDTENTSVFSGISGA